MMTAQMPIASGFGAGTTARQIVAGRNLTGRVAVITGGHSGIGLETTKALSTAGAKIIVGARDVAKARKNLFDVGGVEVLKLDLSDPASVDEFARQTLDRGPSIDILVNNAGIMATPLLRDLSGNEMQFATNHLGHFRLTQRLYRLLKRGSRVINVTSAGHRFAGIDFDDPNFKRRPYDKWKAYGQSKTANSLFTVELDRRAKGDGVRAFAVHPGRIVETDLIRSLSEEELRAAGINRHAQGHFEGPAGVPLKTTAQGAATTLWCALSEDLEGHGGVYCADCDVSEIVPDDSTSGTGVRQWAIDPDLAKNLWRLTEALSLSFL